MAFVYAPRSENFFLLNGNGAHRKGASVPTRACDSQDNLKLAGQGKNHTKYNNNHLLYLLL